MSQLKVLNYAEKEVKNKDFSNLLLLNSNFKNATLENVCFDGTDLSTSIFSNCLFKNCSFKKANLTKVLFDSADLRGCNMSGSIVNGANFYCAMLEGANLERVIADDTTQFFHLRCPEKGAFLGYKKCFDYRMVQLLIPADAKRSSATNITCRCDKAKVLSIKSIDFQTSYKEAVSYVDENFIYKVGEMAIASGYNEDRWVDSTSGIHFFMTREEAIGYL